MSEIQTGGPVDDRPLDVANVPSSAGELFSPAELTQQLGRGEANFASQYGVASPETGEQILPPEPAVAKDDLNKQVPADLASQLHFENDLPQSVADNIIQAKRDEMMRQSALERRPAGILAGAATMGMGLLNGALDPLNLATAFIPGIGEIRAATIAGRVGIAAAEGAAQQAPLVGLRYALSKGEQANYSLGDAIGDVAFGAILGGGARLIGEGIRGGAGALAESIGLKSPEAAEAIDGAPLAAREGALRTSLAQLAEDRPVEVSPYFDSSGGMFDTATRLSEAQRLAADPTADAHILPEAKLATTPELEQLQAENEALAAHIERIEPGHDMTEADAATEQGESLSRAYEQAASCLSLA